MNVSSGQVSSGVTLTNDSMYVSSGGIASTTVVNSWSYLYVYSGGTAKSTTLTSNGHIHVYSGGTATDIVASSGARLHFEIAPNTYIQGIYAGSTFKVSNAIISGYTINSYGALYISSGGLAKNISLERYGYMAVHSGGVASNATIKTYGSMYVSNGGVLSSANVNSQGRLCVSSGGTAVGISASAGAWLSLTVAPDTYIQGTYAGSSFEIKDATVSNFSIESGNTLYVFSGASATGLTVNSAGTLYISSGASVSNINWTPCVGNVYVDGGATVTFASNYQGVYLGSNNNLLSSAMVMSGGSVYGSMYVFDGGIVNSTTVYGSMYVYSGGVANSPSVVNYGELIVYAGGSTSEAFVEGGTQTVYGLVSSTTLSGSWIFDYSLAVQNIESGGSAIDTIVSSFAVQNIGDGGVASNTIIAGGSACINAGASSVKTTIQDGYMYVSSGGHAEHIAVQSGGYLYVSSGATARNVDYTPFTGSVYFESPDDIQWENAPAGVYYGSGTYGLLVSSSLIMSGISMQSGYGMKVYDSGVLNDISTDRYSYIEVYSGGSAANLRLNKWSRLYVSAGGKASYVTLDTASAFVNEHGSADNVYIADSAYLTVYRGAKATQVTVSGTLYASNGAIIEQVNVASQGNVQVAIGASVRSIQQDVGGNIITVLSGSGNSTLVSGKNVLGDFYQSGNIAHNFIFYQGGTQTVCSGASACDTTIDNGAIQTVKDGGTVCRTTVRSGGYIYVSSGGDAQKVSLKSGAEMIVANAVVADAVIEGGAKIQIDFNGQVTGTSAGEYYSSRTGTTTRDFVVPSGYIQIVSSGYNAEGTIIASGGVQSVYAGGSATGTVVSGGLCIVSSCAKFDSATVLSGGLSIYLGTISNLVVSGGSAIASAWNTSGIRIEKAQIYGGSLTLGNSTSLVNAEVFGGSLQISRGLASSVRIHSGGVMSGRAADYYDYIDSNLGSAIDVAVESGGMMIVTPLQYVSGVVLSAGAVMDLQSGGSAFDIRQEVGGVISATTVDYDQYSYDPFMGMAISSATIASGRNEFGDFSINGGTATNFVLYSGGNLYVDSYDSAVHTVIKDGGLLTAGNYARLDDSEVSSGGRILLSGTSAKMSGGVVHSGGAVIVGKNATVTAVDFENGVELMLDLGAVVSGRMNGSAFVSSAGNRIYGFNIFSGYSQYVGSGQSSLNAVVLNGGRMTVASGGCIDGVTVSSGGYLYISSGASAIDVHWTPGEGIVSAHSAATVMYADQYAGCYLASGGRMLGQSNYMSGINITNGSMYVFSSGVAENVALNGGIVYVGSSGRIVGMTINSGSLNVNSDASVDGLLLNYGGSAVVANMAEVKNITLNSGSLLTVNSGGKAVVTQYGSGIISAMIGAEVEIHNRSFNEGDAVAANAGFSYYDANIGFGGELRINSGALLSRATLASGGYLYVADGASASDIRIVSGGYLESADTTELHNIVLEQGAAFAGFTNVGDDPLTLVKVVSGVVYGELKDATISGTAVLAADVSVSGLSGEFTLDLSRCAQSCSIHGNDFTHTKFVFGDVTNLDLSGNYWGTTDIDAIYASLGIERGKIDISDVLSVNPSSVVFAIEATDLVKNHLRSGSDTIEVIFTGIVDASTVSTDTVMLRDNTGKLHSVKNVQTNGNRITVTLNNLMAEGIYTLVFSSSIADANGNALSSLRFSDLGTGIGDQIRFNASVSGPIVLKTVPAGDVAGKVGAFQVYFNKSVDPGSLVGNVRLVTPGGAEIVPSAIRMVTDTVAEFTVPEQFAVGNYSVRISENITDYSGNKLNQNGNGVNGEAQDSFTGVFNLTDIDLTITEVEVSQTLTPGAKTQIAWKTSNESGTALLGSWTDGVYLSTDKKWDVNDKLLTTYTHADGLLAGEKLSAQTLFAISGVREGNYYLLVRSDINNDEDSGVADAVAAQNLKAVAVSVAIPTLTEGIATAGHVDNSGDFAVYKFTQTAGESMTVALDTLADAANMELYLGYGFAPTREKYDAKLQRITDGSLTLSDTATARDVYVMVYAKSVPGALDYTVTADVAPLQIEKFTQSSQDNSRDITLTITGAQFTNETTATLVDEAGREYSLAVTRTGSTRMSATITAGTLPEGEYRLKLSDTDTVFASDTVTISGAGTGKLEYSFEVPATVGRAAVSTLYLGVANTGTASIDSPLIFFTPTQWHEDKPETLGAELTLDSSSVSTAFWVSSTPNGYTDSLSFFVSGENVGELLPGESVTVPITYLGWRSDDWDFGNSHINWNIATLSSDDTTRLNWANVFADSGLLSSTAQTLGAAFSEEFGNTWGGYYDMVISNLKYLSSIGDVSVKNTSDLLRFEVLQKSGVLQPFAQLVSDTDIRKDGNSLDMVIRRSYAGDIASRDTAGSFGYGWNCDWDVKLEIAVNGDVTYIEGESKTLYQPNYSNGFQNTVEDGSKLVKNSVGYRLTLASGTVKQFDQVGRLLSVTALDNERLSCSYDANGNIVRLTNTSSGEYLAFQRDPETGFVTAITDKNGRTVNYSYEDGDLVEVTDSVSGVIARYEYYGAREHALTKAVSADGSERTFAYDGIGRVTKLTKNSGSIELAYGDNGEVTLTSSNGDSMTLFFGADGNIAKAVDNVSGIVYTYSYSANGGFISGSTSDGGTTGDTLTFFGERFGVRGSGNDDYDRLMFNATYKAVPDSYTVDGLTYYKRDAEGNALEQDEEVAEYYLTAYNAEDKLVSYQYLKDGVTTTYTVTADGGYSVTVDDPSTYFVVDGIKYYKKDMQGNVLDQSDTTTDSYTLGYDADGNRIYYGTTQNGKTTSYHYDIAGNLISLTNENGTTQYTYDANGNKIGEIRPDGSSYVYDASGNVTTYTDTNKKLTAVYYYNEQKTKCTNIDITVSPANNNTLVYGTLLNSNDCIEEYTILVENIQTNESCSYISSHGLFVFESLEAGTYLLTIISDTGEYYYREIEVDDSQNNNIGKIQLGISQTLSCDLSIGENSPSSNGTLHLYKGVTKVASVTVSQSGTYSFADIENGEYTLFFKSAKGEEFNCSKTIVLSTTENEFSFETNAYSSLSGIIKRSADGIINSSVIQLTHQDGTIYYEITDSEGYYLFNGLKEGSYTLTCYEDPTLSHEFIVDGSQSLEFNYDLIPYDDTFEENTLTDTNTVSTNNVNSFDNSIQKQRTGLGAGDWLAYLWWIKYAWRLDTYMEDLEELRESSQLKMIAKFSPASPEYIAYKDFQDKFNSHMQAISDKISKLDGYISKGSAASWSSFNAGVNTTLNVISYFSPQVAAIKTVLDAYQIAHNFIDLPGEYYSISKNLEFLGKYAETARDIEHTIDGAEQAQITIGAIQSSREAIETACQSLVQWITQTNNTYPIPEAITKGADAISKINIAMTIVAGIRDAFVIKTGMDISDDCEEKASTVENQLKNLIALNDAYLSILYQKYEACFPPQASITYSDNFIWNDQNNCFTITLDASNSSDSCARERLGIKQYDWYIFNKKSGWQQIGSTSESTFTYDQEVNTKVAYAVSVIDNDNDRNVNGTRLNSWSNSTAINGVLITVETPSSAVIPQITCNNDDDGSVPLEAGQSFTFILTGSATNGNAYITVTNYDWSVGSGNNSTRSITVTAQQDGNGIKYVWDCGNGEKFEGTSLHVTLGVTANGKESDNRAGITLSVSSDNNGGEENQYGTPIGTSQPTGSVDPNDKTVAEGVGEAGYVAAGSKLSYKVEFENDPEFATAPAQWVRIFDTLDAEKFDLDTFELQNFCIAGNFFNVGDGRDSFNDTVTLQIYDYTVTATVAINLVTDEETGVTQLVAEFMAIDPESGFMLQDLVKGMLPVNDAIGAGEGYINYTVNAKKDLAHGTEITNTAKIYFDFNDPIDTPTTLNTIDLVKPEAAFTLSETQGIINLVFNGNDADSGIAGYNIMYSTDGVNFSDYGYSTYDKLNIAGTAGTTYYFKVQAVDKVGNASGWSAVQSLKVTGALPENLAGSVNGLTWDAVSNTAGYVVEYSIDNFEHFVRLESATNSISSFCLPQGSYQWRVRTLESSEWVTGENIVSSEAATPRLLNPEADGNMDVFFANASGKWVSGYAAQHTGILNGWDGTNEQVILYGKNKLADIFEGSSDANILVMTDDTHGDALFVDDIYTALPGTVAEQQARIARIDEIRAGNGDDIVDMTSQRFAYIGDGVKIYGGLGNDTIWANNGNNALFGDAGNDRLVGGSNNDVIIGGSGDDSMHGGGGDDIFCFGGNFGTDTIEQLDGGEITLWFESGEMSNWNADTLTYSDGTNSVKVSGVSNDNITLIFGDDGSLRYDELATVGCFDDAASEKIFEDKNKGMLA